ncbi:MAG TPA: hypothetical protein VL500_02750, partial [Candidatus Eisenbacteria bacterium]|nr:hypothetical protein [Candidatus Eisenbacteria bacterium]
AEKRLGAVNFVARKMVLDQVPPCDNHLTDKRFEVDISAMAPLPVTEIAKKPAAADPGCEEIKFDL